MHNGKVFFLSIVLGGGIGLFPLLMGQARVAPAEIADTTEMPEKSFVLDIDNQESILLKNGHTYIPVRFLEKWGSKISWDPKERKVHVTFPE